jgi:HlyD family secretion protein
MIFSWSLLGSRIRQSARSRPILQWGTLVGMVALLSTQSTTVAAQGVTPTDTSVVEQGSLTITLNATGSLSPVQQVELAFELSAPVIEVLVTEGQRVQAGDVLARLESVDAESVLRNAEISLAQARAAYANLTQPPRDVDVAVAQAQVTVANASLYSASLTAPSTDDKEIARLQMEIARNQLWQSQLNRDIQLAPNPEFRNGNGGAQAGEISANAQVQSQEYNVEIQDSAYENTLNGGADASALSSGHASLVQAQADLDNLLNPASAAELRRAEIDVETAQLELQKAQEQLAQTTLIAPISGLIANENLTVGEAPPTSDVITLIEDSHYTIDLAIDETDIVNIEIGQRVDLNVVALPDAVITGSVTKVDSTSTIEGQLVTYTATVTLDFTGAFLRPAMSATATIITGEVENVVLVPNRFIRVDNETQTTFVTVEDSGQYHDAPVTIGVRNDVESQILSGLQAGQTIVLLPSQSQSQSQGGLFGGPPGGGADVGG